MTTGNVRLTDEPQSLMTGMKAYRNPKNGYVCVLLHFTSDPESASEEQRRQGLSDEQFKREHDLDFSSWGGKPAIQGFTERDHVAYPIGTRSMSEPDPTLPMWRGWDFGYHRPACVWVQVHGGLWVYGEALGEDMTLAEFVTRVVLPYQERYFPNHRELKWFDGADFAGRQVSDKSEHTSITILHNFGIFPFARKTEINEGLTLLRATVPDGRLLIHPRCQLIREGLKGGYRYPEPTTGLPEPMYPLKDGFYEHIFDALRYVAVNAMSLYATPGAPEKKEPTHVEKVLARKKNRYQDEDLGLYG